MTILSMSHDQNVFHAMLITIQKPLSPELIGQSPLVLVCNIMDMGSAKCVQMMIIG